jgi:hypothetical protein
MPRCALEFIRPLLPATGRVLAAGPHRDDILVELAAEGLAVEVLLRSESDATAAADRLPASIGVRCGSLTRLDRTYDAVIALDGLDRLASADAPVDGWTDALDALTAAVAPDGLLALVARNGLGVDRMAGLAPCGVDRSDAYAVPRRALHDRLTLAGFDTVASIALYPGAVEPSLLVPTGVFDAPGETLSALVAAAYRSSAGADALVDPARLARASLAHGLGSALAPAWLIVVRRGGAGTAAAPNAVIVADSARWGFSSVPQVIDAAPGGAWTRRLMPGVRAGDESYGGVHRRLDRLNHAIPPGALLEDRLLDAAGAHDLVTVRRLVATYARWLGVHTGWLDEGWDDIGRPANAPVVESGTDALDPNDRAFAVADNVIESNGTLRRLDSSWSHESAADVVPAEAVFLAALQRFAQRLLAAALPHPWTVAQPPARLAARLASMIGLEVTDEMSAAAAEAAALHAVAFDPDAERGTQDVAFDDVAFDAVAEPVGTRARPPLTTVARALTTGPVDPAGPVATPRGLVEARRTIDALTAELAGAHAQLRLLSATIADRDRRLASTNRMLAVVKGTRAFRIARVARGPLQAVLKPLGALRRRVGR